MGCAPSTPAAGASTLSPVSPAKVAPLPSPAKPTALAAKPADAPTVSPSTAPAKGAGLVEKKVSPAGAGHPAVKSGQHAAMMQAAGASGQTIVFVLGAPGAGKGTQCEKLVKQFGYFQISTGDLLREEVASGSELGEKLKSIMAEGALVSTELVLALVKKAMETSDATKFLLDGYPRAQDQAIEFEKTIGKPAFVLAFEADEATLEERLVNRGLTSGRADDNRESIKKRFATFKSQSEAVIDYYKSQDLVRSINSLRHPDEVFAEVACLFDASCEFRGLRVTENVPFVPFVD